MYNLIAAVNHQPKSDDKGHYTAVTKHQTMKSWFEYNDDDVHRINFIGRNNNFSAVRYQCMASIFFLKLTKVYEAVVSCLVGQMEHLFEIMN